MALPTPTPHGVHHDNRGTLAQVRAVSVMAVSGQAAGLKPPPTFHELRHFYASLLIRHGESVKVVQSRLGHATAAETLDTYSHLWPDSEDCTRAAVDSVLGVEASDKVAQ